MDSRMIGNQDVLLLVGQDCIHLNLVKPYWGQINTNHGFNENNYNHEKRKIHIETKMAYRVGRILYSHCNM